MSTIRFRGALLGLCLSLASLSVPGCGDDGPSCTPQAGTTCLDGIAYWVDSCGEIEGFLEACSCGCAVDGVACASCGGPCEQEPCSGHGVCDDSSGQAVCACEPAYAGDHCEACAGNHHQEASACVPDDPCLADSCSGHGVCDDTSGLFSCACEPAYSGARCADCAAGYHESGGACVQDASCLAASCSNHGTCSDATGEPVCTCEPAYAGPACAECSADHHWAGDACVPNEHCAVDSCSGHGACADDDGAITCSCDPGFSGARCDNGSPEEPREPSPADGAAGIPPLGLTLAWAATDPDGDPLSFEVYLGASEATATLVATVDEIAPGAGGSYASADLALRSPFTWRVVASDDRGGRTVGPWWTFRTGSRAPCPGAGTVTDADGNTYDTVLIDTQCWTAENMRSGTRIGDAQSPANDGVVQKWCPGDNDARCLELGGLYTWDEVMQGSSTAGARGLCPTGWHVPTHEEWQALVAFLGSGGWDVNPRLLAGGSSGFDAELAGYRYYQGGYEYTGELVVHWTSTTATNTAATAWNIDPGDNDPYSTNWRKTSGLSVRCLRD